MLINPKLLDGPCPGCGQDIGTGETYKRVMYDNGGPKQGCYEFWHSWCADKAYPLTEATKP